MWSYYELLTDLSPAEIAVTKRRIATGELHPMEAKKQLGYALVKDFHSPEAAVCALGEWEKIVQRGEEPGDIPAVDLPRSACQGNDIHIDRLLPKIGLAESRTDATRKIKAGSVYINKLRYVDLVLSGQVGIPFTVQVGKQWRRVRQAVCEDN
jgi:tyrosyl-tRNA synthetase